jgi:PAS domain S-box-containing protein
MTPPTQPELQAFRRWVCGEIQGQLGGAEPTAWSMDREPPALPGIDVDWDTREVTHAEVGRVAVDEANQIFAVSPGALALLGYDEPDDLLGRRIVTIVPERFRQAHVAGFTLFLLTGRRPLIDRTVTVPVLRRDGSEVPAELTLSVQQARDGHFVFVADLRPA